MQIRVLPDVYNRLFERKIELEKERRKQVSFNEVLSKLLMDVEVIQ